MKKLCLCTLTALLMALCFGCTEPPQQKPSVADGNETQEVSDVPEQEVSDAPKQEFRVVNVLLATGKQGRSSSTVAYLLLENDEVVVYGYALKPLSKEQARNIMKFQMGDTVMVASHK